MCVVGESNCLGNMKKRRKSQRGLIYIVNDVSSSQELFFGGSYFRSSIVVFEITLSW